MQAFGGRVVRHVPVHGKATEIEHDGAGLFAGLPSPLTVGRYHSLVAEPDLPDCLEVTARGGGVVMAVRHRELPAARRAVPPGVGAHAGRQAPAGELPWATRS